MPPAKPDGRTGTVMFGIPPRAWLLPLLLSAMAALWGVPVTGGMISCVHRNPCMNTEALQERANCVARNISSAHDWRILLQMKHFRKITRWPKLHSCVMTRVAGFYERALRRKLGLEPTDPIGHHRGPIVDLIGLMHDLETCSRVDKKKCQVLVANAEKMASHEKPTTKMKPRDWAIRQIQHLNQALEKLSDADTLDKAMDELKFLHNYIKGTGIRKWAKAQ
ncbi:hypothetical protein ACEWY4_017068 [Coilia grayii]|uniref:Uncharacterized protein n=1 Tax=Coilia grayii TaxID=363190 RepID=A0ABD1JNJ5_9TELE